MPTYYEVMQTDLSKLTTAAGKWDAMAGEFKKLEDQYKRDVHGVTVDGSWAGLSATAAKKRLDGTLYELQAAQTEAKAIASLLRDAHTQFVDLRKKVESARDDAIKVGMKVSDQGIASFDFSKVDAREANTIRHDPDLRGTEQSWTAHIRKAVSAMDDADQGVKIALEAVVVDSNKDAFGRGNDAQLNGFNADAQLDIEIYEARLAEEIATRINSGEMVSAADYAELNRSFRDNGHDKTFSQAFLRGLGPDGTIKLVDRLNDRAYDSDKKNKSQYLDLQKGLANTVASATEVPGKVSEVPPGSKAFEKWLASEKGTFYREFTDGLNVAGVKSDDSETGNPLYGYQSFVSLMQHADTKFDDQFLYDLGDDLIAAEDDHPGIFTKWGRGHDGIETDAIDGLLGVMSKNPDAATAFFDAKGNGVNGDKVTNDHLHYLAGSGDGTRDWPRNTVLGISVTTMDDPSSRVGLGAALEAATTGHVPLKPGQDPWPVTPHTDAQARVMHNVIGELGPSQSIHENMREPLARSLSSYTSDTHEILGGMTSDYVVAAADGGTFEKGGTTHMAVTQKDLVQFMRGLSDDPEAYATLHKAESRYISLEMEKIPNGSSGFAQSNPLSQAGAALGTYSAIREDVLNDTRMSEYTKADWQAKIAYHVIGGAVTPLYFTTAAGVSIAFGDSIQRGVDTWAWQFGNSLKAEADTTANAAISEHYLNANNQMQLMVDSWAKDRNDIDPNEVKGLTNAILDGHDRGTNTAQKYLTDTTN